MKKDFSNIILLSDMDGTLLDSQGKVSEENKKAIEYFVEHKGRFGVATGRAHYNGINFLDGVVINIPCIMFNGGMLYDINKDKALIINELPKEKLVSYVRQCLEELPHVTLHIYSEDMCYIVSEEALADPQVVEDHKPNEFCSVDDILDKPWIKLLFSGKKEELKRLEELIDIYELNNNVNSIYSQETYFEIVPAGASKGTLLNQLREYMGGDYTIYAMGDYNNDIELVKAADVGIATKNALEELKLLADKITVSNDESAVADVIYNVII
ncbi:MAG: HAD family hydrolase [Clostridiales bacterium]|nr:HAD family hydrolase [Clostridiales bacterium]